MRYSFCQHRFIVEGVQQIPYCIRYSFCQRCFFVQGVQGINRHSVFLVPPMVLIVMLFTCSFFCIPSLSLSSPPPPLPTRTTNQPSFWPVRANPSCPPKHTNRYVGQVDYDATPNELQSHFEACGTINRVTILCDKFTGRPKGYAYIEFADLDGAENALTLENSVFKGRNLKVMNVSGYGRLQLIYMYIYIYTYQCGLC